MLSTLVSSFTTTILPVIVNQLTQAFMIILPIAIAVGFTYWLYYNFKSVAWWFKYRRMSQEERQDYDEAYQSYEEDLDEYGDDLRSAQEQFSMANGGVDFDQINNANPHSVQQVYMSEDAKFEAKYYKPIDKYGFDHEQKKRMASIIYS